MTLLDGIPLTGDIKLRAKGDIAIAFPLDEGRQMMRGCYFAPLFTPDPTPFGPASSMGELLYHDGDSHLGFQLPERKIYGMDDLVYLVTGDTKGRPDSQHIVLNGQY